MRLPNAACVVFLLLAGTATCGNPGRYTAGASDSATHTKVTGDVPKDMQFEPSWRQRGDCGPLSLYVLMRLQGRQVSIEEVENVLRFDREVGCSLADVGGAADALGFDREIRYVKPSELSRLSFPFILHAAGSLERGTGHFLVVVGYSAEKREYYVIDTTYETFRSQTEESVLKGFTGYVLIPKSSAGAAASRWAVWVLVCMGCALAVVIVYRHLSPKKQAHLSTVLKPNTSGADRP